MIPISASTGTDGKRVIYNSCYNLFGMTQPETWRSAFGSAEDKFTGLLPRLLPIDTSHVRLDIETYKKMTEIDILNNIKILLLKISDKTSNMPEITWLVADANNDKIEEIKNKVLNTPACKLIMSHEIWNISNMSKMIVRAIKMSVVESVLNLQPYIPKKKIDNLDFNDDENIDCGFGSSAIPIAENYKDFNILQRILSMLVIVSIKASLADVPMGEVEEVEKKIYDLMIKSKSGVTARSIQNRHLKLNNRNLNSYEVKDRFESLEEKGLAKISKNINSVIATWTGKKWNP
jgi:hypothetical protein